jgi:hypothetical protein
VTVQTTLSQYLWLLTRSTTETASDQVQSFAYRSPDARQQTATSAAEPSPSPSRRRSPPRPLIRIIPGRVPVQPRSAPATARPVALAQPGSLLPRQSGQLILVGPPATRPPARQVLPSGPPRHPPDLWRASGRGQSALALRAPQRASTRRARVGPCTGAAQRPDGPEQPIQGEAGQAQSKLAVHSKFAMTSASAQRPVSDGLTCDGTLASGM